MLATHLRREGIAPELVLCSSARRAQETLAGIEAALGDGVSVQVEPELYGASQRDLLERLRTIPDATQSLMVIGHNPSIQTLALTLAESGDELERIQRKYPTGGAGDAHVRRRLERAGAARGAARPVRRSERPQLTADSTDAGVSSLGVL